MTKCALVMAGGTGGHIFPGLAVAEALRDRSWRVHWIGGPGSMESQLVPPRGFAFETIAFSGVRGKGVMTLVLLPLRLLKAFWQSIQVVRRVKPDVVIGLGGYVTAKNGEIMAFSFIYNGNDRWNAKSTMDAMGATLANFVRE